MTFETAVRVFSDPEALLELDRIAEGEERWRAIGKIEGQVVLVVAHTVREEDEGETIRIISARSADRRERRRYEEENRPL